MVEKDLNEVLMDHDEMSEDETVGELEHSDPDPESLEDEDFSLDDIVFEEDEDEDDEEEDVEDEDDEEEDDDEEF